LSRCLLLPSLRQLIDLIGRHVDLDDVADVVELIVGNGNCPTTETQEPTYLDPNDDLATGPVITLSTDRFRPTIWR
jgi:hypothetical protein